MCKKGYSGRRVSLPSPAGKVSITAHLCANTTACGCRERRMRRIPSSFEMGFIRRRFAIRDGNLLIHRFHLQASLWSFARKARGHFQRSISFSFTLKMSCPPSPLEKARLRASDHKTEKIHLIFFSLKNFYLLLIFYKNDDIINLLHKLNK